MTSSTLGRTTVRNMYTAETDLELQAKSLQKASYAAALQQQVNMK